MVRLRLAGGLGPPQFIQGECGGMGWVGGWADRGDNYRPAQVKPSFLRAQHNLPQTCPRPTLNLPSASQLCPLNLSQT